MVGIDTPFIGHFRVCQRERSFLSLRMTSSWDAPVSQMELLVPCVLHILRAFSALCAPHTPGRICTSPPPRHPSGRFFSLWTPGRSHIVFFGMHSYFVIGPPSGAEQSWWCPKTHRLCSKIHLPWLSPVLLNPLNPFASERKDAVPGMNFFDD